MFIYLLIYILLDIKGNVYIYIIMFIYLLIYILLDIKGNVYVYIYIYMNLNSS